MKKEILLMTIFLLSGRLASAQEWKDDLALIRGEGSVPVREAYYSGPDNNQQVIRTRQKNVLASYNPLTLVLKGTMYMYQHVISPQLARHCPYEITCSNFSKLSIREFGIVKGVFMSSDRILRCNRIGVLDTDPLDFNETNGTIRDAPNKYRQ